MFCSKVLIWTAFVCRWLLIINSLFHPATISVLPNVDPVYGNTVPLSMTPLPGEGSDTDNRGLRDGDVSEIVVSQTEGICSSCSALCQCVSRAIAYLILSYLSRSLADRWGTTVDFTTSFLHSSRFSAFRSALFH